MLGYLLIESLVENLSETWIKVKLFSFKEMCFKMTSAKCRPFGLGLNVFTLQVPVPYTRDPILVFTVPVHTSCYPIGTLRWRHNEHDGVSNHHPHDCLLNGLFRRRSKKTPKLRISGLCAGNSPVTGEFPAQMASDAECFHFMTLSWRSASLAINDYSWIFSAGWCHSERSTRFRTISRRFD